MFCHCGLPVVGQAKVRQSPTGCVLVSVSARHRTYWSMCTSPHSTLCREADDCPSCLTKIKDRFAHRPVCIAEWLTAFGRHTSHNHPESIILLISPEAIWLTTNGSQGYCVSSAMQSGQTRWLTNSIWSGRSTCSSLMRRIRRIPAYMRMSPYDIWPIRERDLHQYSLARF